MRYEYIQFARGYAIFTILLYHVLQRLALTGVAAKAIILGGTGVHLFFFLSGFGLMLSKNTGTPLAFYRRRLVKVWLPYVLALSISLLLAFAWNIFPDRGAAWLAGVAGYQMFFESYIESFGGHFWFISAIIQFYLVFPLLKWGIEQRKRVVAQVDQLGIDIAAGLHVLEDPLGRLLAEAGRAGGRDDDGNLEFGHLSPPW